MRGVAADFEETNSMHQPIQSHKILTDHSTAHETEQDSA
jgi:hypothetical protein